MTTSAQATPPRTQHSRATSHFPLMSRLAVRAPAPRPQPGAVLPTNQGLLVYPVPLPMPMDRCTARTLSSFRAGVASTVQVQTVAALVFIVQDP